MGHHDQTSIDSRIECGDVEKKAIRQSYLAQVVFVLLCAETIFSLSYRSVYLTGHSVLPAWVAGLCALAVAGIFFFYTSQFAPAISGPHVESPFGRQPDMVDILAVLWTCPANGMDIAVSRHA